ncbi:MAG: TonB-dependent receptor domain-containing protein, partial [Halothiobacillus sp.]
PAPLSTSRYPAPVTSHPAPTPLALAIASALALTFIAPSVQAADNALPAVTINDDALVDPNTTSITPENPRLAPGADVTDQLSSIAGVWSSRKSGHGNDLIIRGQRDNQINTWLDGASIQGACPNRMDPPTSFSTLIGYDRIVVDKGVSSLQYGAGGSGGTVHMERDTDALAEQTGVHGKIDYSLNSNGLNGQGGADVLASNGHAYLRAIGSMANGSNYKDGNGTEVPASYKQRTGALIAGYKFDEASGVEASVERNRMYDVRYAALGMDSIFDNATTYRLKGWLGNLSGPVSAIKAEVYRTNVDHLMDSYTLRSVPVGGMKMYSPATAKTTGGRVTLTSYIGAVKVNYGLDAVRVERNAGVYTPTNPKTPMFRQWPGTQNDQVGAFSEATWQLTSVDTLKGGLRIDRFSSKLDSTLGNSIATDAVVPAATRSAAKKDQSNTELSALLRYEHLFSAELKGYAGISRTAVAPDATQLYSLLKGKNSLGQPVISQIGNPNLTPERHNQINLGLSGANGALTWDGSIYYDRVQNYILQDRAPVGTNPLSTVFRNINAELYGFDGSARYALTQTLSLRGQLAYVRGKDTSDGRNLPQMPPVTGTVGMDYTQGQWQAGTSLDFAARATHIDTRSGLDKGETGGFGVANLYVAYKVTPRWQISTGIDNVFDKTYSMHVNRQYSALFGNPNLTVNEPGRTVWAKLNGSF